MKGCATVKADMSLRLAAPVVHDERTPVARLAVGRALLDDLDLHGFTS